MEKGFQPEQMSPEQEAKKAAFEAYMAEQAAAIEKERAEHSIPEVNFSKLTPPEEPLGLSPTTKAAAAETDEPDFNVDFEESETELKKSA